MTFEGALILIPREVVMPFTGFLVHLGEKAITICRGCQAGNSSVPEGR